MRFPRNALCPMLCAPCFCCSCPLPYAFRLPHSKFRPQFPLPDFCHLTSTLCPMFPALYFPLPHSAFPIPHSDFPLPHSAFQIPHSHFRIPTSPFPTPHSPFRIPTSAFNSFPQQYRRWLPKNHLNGRKGRSKGGHNNQGQRHAQRPPVHPV